jgi:hypothetical protein
MDLHEERAMLQTVEAVIEPDGQVRLLEPIKVAESRRALVTVLAEPADVVANEAALLSEAALSNWNSEEEDAAWAHLQ